MLAAMAHDEDAFQHDLTARPLDRIVVGVDFSEVSLAAAQWVGRHLARDAALTLVHVIEPPPKPNVSRLRSAPMPDPESRLRARIESLRGALHGLSGVVGGTDTRIEVRVGDPVVQLAAYADLVEADLVVVGGNVVSRAAVLRLSPWLFRAHLTLQSRDVPMPTRCHCYPRVSGLHAAAPAWHRPVQTA